MQGLFIEAELTSTLDPLAQSSQFDYKQTPLQMAWNLKSGLQFTLYYSLS